MKYFFIAVSIAFFPFLSYAADPKIEVKIASLTNLANSSALEVCGTAVHSEGFKPILVTVKHGNSKYTTLASSEGDWCVVVKRHNFDGSTEAEGVLLKDL